MIFPEKPRPPWREPKPVKIVPRAVDIEPQEQKPQRPPGYWRERIEFGLIVVGMYFWIQFWLQYR